MIRMSLVVMGMVGAITAGGAIGAGCSSEEGTGGAGGGGGESSSNTSSSQSGSGSVSSTAGTGGAGQGGAGGGTGGAGQGGSVSTGEGGGGGGPIDGGAPAECTSAADCRLFSSYCEMCECIPLAKTEPDPVCMGQMVNCIVDPCQDKKPACSSSGGQCIVQ